MPAQTTLEGPIEATDVLSAMRKQQDAMVDLLDRFVSTESPSRDARLISACVGVVADACEELVGARPEVVGSDGAPHLMLRFGQPRVLLLGHLDTVWPAGTLQRWPFSVSGGRASGPGAFDMKAGLVQGLFALSQLDDLDGIAFLITTDEETGSATSRGLIEGTARSCDACLVLEASAAGALKTARKGVSIYTIEAHGRASHAGLEPEKGINASAEIAHQILALPRIARPDLGTTVTPTVMSAGTATNVVPAHGQIAIDVRVFTQDEQDRVHAEITRLQAATPGATLTVRGGANRPPLPATSSASLFRRASRNAEALGLGPLTEARVGGASDGNFTAAIGIQTLDGLGAVGDGAHAEGEYVEVDAMPERAALLAMLIASLREERLGHPDELAIAPSSSSTKRADDDAGTMTVT